ncbi:MAG: glycosyltransferase family 39 protein [Clostridia bacterium]|nr:glycosyltransferase family 39 protein [Clostridia bacterium]
MKLRDTKGRTKNNDKLFFVIIFLLALFLRLHFIFNVEYPLMDDGENYLNMARRIVSGHGYGYLSDSPNAYVTPGYPLFLAFFLWMFGDSGGMTVIQITQCILGAFTSVISALIGKQIMSRNTGILSGLLVAVYPPFIMSSLCILTECLYLFFFLLYFYFQLISLDLISYSYPREKLKGRFLLSGLCGILFSLSVLIRPTVLPLALFPYIYKLVQARGKRDQRRLILTESAVFLICGCAVMLPWWIRNITVLGEFIILSQGSGNPLLFGTFPDMQIPDGYYIPPDKEFSEALSRIKNGFSSEPIKYFLWYTVGKFKYIFFNIWYYLPGPISPRYHNLYLPFVHYFSVVTGWMAVVFSVVFGRIRFISIYVSLLTLLQLCFIPSERYAYTILPLLMICASAFALHCFSLIKREYRITRPDI